MKTLMAALAKAIVATVALALPLTACSAGLTQVLPPAHGALVQPASGDGQAAAGGARALAARKYTMATVKKHHKKSDCWTVIGKGVYKLTGFIRKHPGGARRIIALCGKNGTAAFRAQHGTGGKANRVLKTYEIGVLV